MSQPGDPDRTDPGGSPRVSVVMPMYNTAAYLAEAVESILRQTYADFEFVIVDDGSTDGSLQIAQQFATRDPRIVVLSRPREGIVAALNAGVEAARGELIARMDADDVSERERLALQVAFLDSHPDCIAVSSQMTAVDPEGMPMAVTRLPLDHEEIVFQLFHPSVGFGIAHAATTFRRSALDAVGGYRSQYEFVEDFDLFVRLSEYGRLAALPDRLYRQRHREGSVGTTHRALQRERKQAVLRCAAVRHGHDAVETEMAPLQEVPSMVERRRMWASQACYYGFRRTAIKNALIAVHRQPFSTASWGVLVMVTLGSRVLRGLVACRNLARRILRKVRRS